MLCDLFHFDIRCRHWLPFCLLAFPTNEKKILDTLSIMVKWHFAVNTSITSYLLMEHKHHNSRNSGTNKHNSTQNTHNQPWERKYTQCKCVYGHFNNSSLMHFKHINDEICGLNISSTFMSNHNRSKHYINSDCTCINSLLIRVWLVCSSQHPSRSRCKNTFIQSVSSEQTDLWWTTEEHTLNHSR